MPETSPAWPRFYDIPGIKGTTFRKLAPQTEISAGRPCFTQAKYSDHHVEWYSNPRRSSGGPYGYWRTCWPERPPPPSAQRGRKSSPGCRALARRTVRPKRPADPSATVAALAPRCHAKIDPLSARPRELRMGQRALSKRQESSRKFQIDPPSLTPRSSPAGQLPDGPPSFNNVSRTQPALAARPRQPFSTACAKELLRLRVLGRGGLVCSPIAKPSIKLPHSFKRDGYRCPG